MRLRCFKAVIPSLLLLGVMLIFVGIFYYSIVTDLHYLCLVSFFAPFIIPSIFSLVSNAYAKKESNCKSSIKTICMSVAIPISCIMYFLCVFLPSSGKGAVIKTELLVTYIVASIVMGEITLIFSWLWKKFSNRLLGGATTRRTKQIFWTAIVFIMVLFALIPNAFDIFSMDIEELLPYLIILYLVFVPVIISAIMGKFIFINYDVSVLQLLVFALLTILMNCIISIGAVEAINGTAFALGLSVSCIDILVLLASYFKAKKKQG